MSEWGWVAIAYGAVYLMVTLYTLSVHARLRRTLHRLGRR